MVSKYQAIKVIQSIPGKAEIPEKTIEILSPDDPAIRAMIDISNTPFRLVSPDRQIDEAIKKMQAARVHFMLVLGTGGAFQGVIGDRDLVSRKVLAFMTTQNVSRQEVLVRDLMIRKERVYALDFAKVQQARIGDIVETLRQLDSGAILVISEENDRTLIRGAFTAAEIYRKLSPASMKSDNAMILSELRNLLQKAAD